MDIVFHHVHNNAWYSKQLLGIVDQVAVDSNVLKQRFIKTKKCRRNEQVGISETIR